MFHLRLRVFFEITDNTTFGLNSSESRKISLFYSSSRNIAVLVPCKDSKICVIKQQQVENPVPENFTFIIRYFRISIDFVLRKLSEDVRKEQALQKLVDSVTFR